MKKVLILQNTILQYRKAAYNELAKHYDVTILHSGKATINASDYYKEILVPVRKWGPFYFQSGVFTAVKDRKYDVIIAMFDIRWVANIFALFMASGRRFLYWGHGYGKNTISNKIREFLMKRCDGVILYSDSDLNRLKSHGIEGRKIFTAHNTIYVSNHSDRSGLAKDSFLFTGRAQKRKKVDVLIQAFSEIVDKIPNHVCLNIIGSGQENEFLKNLALRLGIHERVRFLGEITDDSGLKPFFESAYAYVSPGPVGLGVLHSFAYGVPVVTGKFEKHGPEFANISDGVNSLVYESYSELKEILASFIVDEGLSARLGGKAYEVYSKSRTIEKMVSGFLDAIEVESVKSAFNGGVSK